MTYISKCHHYNPPGALALVLLWYKDIITFDQSAMFTVKAVPWSWEEEMFKDGL